MQFEDLIRVPKDEEGLLEKYHHSRYMMQFEDKKYPVLDSLFDKNLEVCSKYMSRQSIIKYSYVADGRTILGNHIGVCGQEVHTDYSSSGMAKYFFLINCLLYIIYLFSILLF